jgi:tRNA(Ile)-lysidine synthase
MTGHKKIKALYIDEKIERSLRRRIPLFFSGNTLFWVAGMRQASGISPSAEEISCARIEILDFPSSTAILG